MVGFPLHLRAAGAGFGSAFIDLDQVGFLSPAPPGDPDRHRTKARALADLWRNYRTAGARRLTIVGPATDEATLRAHVDTDGATVAEVADAVAATADLPGSP